MERPALLGRDLQQSRFVGLPLGTGQAGDSLDCQPRFRQAGLNRSLHQACAGVTFTADTQPKRGGVPTAGSIDLGPDGKLGADGWIAGKLLHCAQQRARIRLMPRPHPGGLANADLRAPGLPLHQLPPGSGAAATSPPPGMADSIEGQPPFTGAGSRQHGKASEVGGQFPGQLLGSAAVTSK